MSSQRFLGSLMGSRTIRGFMEMKMKLPNYQVHTIIPGGHYEILGAHYQYWSNVRSVSVTEYQVPLITLQGVM